MEPRRADIVSGRLPRTAVWVDYQNRGSQVDYEADDGTAGLQYGFREEHRQSSCVRRPSEAGDKIRAYCRQGELGRAVDVLVRLDTPPLVDTYACLLRACTGKKSLAQTKRVHAHLAQNGLECTRFLGEYLVGTLVKCGGLADALHVFTRLQQRTVFSWTAMISGYAESLQAHEALRMYRDMRNQGVNPNTFTFVGLLKACSTIGDLKEGKIVHAEVLKFRCESDLFVGTCLIDMYARCGSVADARHVFDRLTCRDVVTCNGMLVAYVQQGQAEQALQLFGQIRDEGDCLDGWSLATALQACVMLAEKEEEDTNLSVYLQKGKSIHADAWTRGYSSDVVVGSSLVTMYGKCGSIVDAKGVFDGLFEQDLVAWNAMLAACTQQGLGDMALELYESMRGEGVCPDGRSYVSAIQACGMLGVNGDDRLLKNSMRFKHLGKGKELHADALRKGYLSDVFVGNALVTMYGRCGSLEDAQDVFENLLSRDVVTWNALLDMYVRHGQGERALQLYRRMQQECVSMDELTLVCTLQACSSTGCLDICKQIHHSVVSAQTKPSLLLVNTLIHVYGTCASMWDARTVFDNLLQPSVVSWNALIAGYARQGDCAASFQCYEDMQLAGMKPNGVTFLSLLSACTHAGLAEKGVQILESMSRDYGLTPEIEHFASVVDLLGRAGYFTLVESLLQVMPMYPDLSMCLCLLSACRKHGKVVLGKQAFDSAVRLHPQNASAYFLMANIYADSGRWDLANTVYELQEIAGARKEPGQTKIAHELELRRFRVGVTLDTHQNQLYELLEKLRNA